MAKELNDIAYCLGSMLPFCQLLRHISSRATAFGLSQLRKCSNISVMPHRARTPTRYRTSQPGCGTMPRTSSPPQRTGDPPHWPTCPCTRETRPRARQTLWGWAAQRSPTPTATAMRSQVGARATVPLCSHCVLGQDAVSKGLVAGEELGRHMLGSDVSSAPNSDPHATLPVASTLAHKGQQTAPAVCSHKAVLWWATAATHSICACYGLASQ